MKGLFPQYDYTASTNQAETWKTALFVFDTNVLLNLYRYQERTREELFETLDKLSERIWIPHHVALEFQRNRLTVIAAQGRRFSEIRKVIEKAKSDLANGINNLQLTKRHTLINPEPLIAGFEAVSANFLAELDKLQESQQTLTAPDPVKLKIEEIFDGKVGSTFATQADVDKKSKEAEARYKSKIPPGYKDSEKDKDGPDDFYHNGITYKKKFGDYFVWSQLLEHAANSQQKNLIFITDDAKEDWWQQIDFDGPKTIGPRAELKEEASRIGGLEKFLMYKPEGFLKYANEFLAAEVSEETLREVRDVSSDNKKRQSILGNPKHPNSAIYTAIASWILSKHEMIDDLSGSFPDFIASNNGESHAYAVCILDSPVKNEILRTIIKCINAGHISKFETITALFVTTNRMESEETLQILIESQTSTTLDNIFVEIGQYNEATMDFSLYHESGYGDLPPF